MKRFAEYPNWEGILKETITPNSSYANGDLKSANPTNMEHLRCLLDDGGLSTEYWAFTGSVVVYINNCSPTWLVARKILLEAWNWRKPLSKHFHVFRGLAFVHIPKEKPKKLHYRATLAIVVGYRVSTKKYFVYNEMAKTLHRTRDVVFIWVKWYTARNAAEEAILNEHFYRDIIVEPTPTKKQTEISQPIE